MKRRKFDVSSFSFLLQEGISVKEGMAILSESVPKSPEEVIEFLVHQFPSHARGRFLLLLDFLPLQKALSLNIEMLEYEQKRAEYFLKKLTYPILLLVTSVVGLFLFEHFGLASLVSLLGDFSQARGPILLLKGMVSIAYWGMAIMLVIGLGIIICSRNKARRILFYHLLCQWWPNNPVSMLVSQEFITYWCICYKAGLSSKEIFQVLRRQKRKIFTSFLAYHLQQLLEEGKEMRQAARMMYLDPLFAHFANIAYFHENPYLLFEKYLCYSQNRFENEMKKLTQTIIVGVYVAVGMLLILVYQILLLPMQALSRF